MASQLPPDLERLGAALTEATARAAGARRQRVRVARRLAACLVAGMAVFATMAPSSLGPASGPTVLLELAAVGSASAVSRDPCDPPHGTALDCHVPGPPPQVR